MTIECVWEHNDGDTLLHAGNVIGAFTRGSSKEEALGKMPREIGSYFRWRGKEPPSELDIIITEEKASDLNIADADSDVIFASERKRLTLEEYEYLKALTLKPAAVGSYGEEWSLRKLFRRFIWHDRIHAKAMHRMGKAIFGEDAIPDVFYFG